MENNPQLEPIIFRENEDGDLAARIDDLEVGFEPSGAGYIFIWGTDVGAPCEYTNSVCPEEKERKSSNCPIAENCPYLITEEIPFSSSFSNPAHREELEAETRKMFKVGQDSFGHTKEWPQPAAYRFAHAEWRFEE